MAGHNAKGRSTGAKHVRLYRWLLDSPAYRSLSLPARALLIELYSFYNGENNGRVFLSVRDAAALIGVGSSTASRAYQELQDRGFIKSRLKSAFSVKSRRATEWILTEFAYGDALPTKDFMKWQTGKTAARMNGRNLEHSPISGTDSPATGTRVSEVAL